MVVKKKKMRRRVYRNQEKRERPQTYNDLCCYGRLEECIVLILYHQVEKNVEQENDGKMR